MKLTVVLEDHEIRHLKELASTTCGNVICSECPFDVERKDGMHECVRDLVRKCLEQNHIE